MGRTKYSTAVALTFLAAAGAVLGAPPDATAAGHVRAGTLDPTFGDGGRVLATKPMETAPSEFVALAGGPRGELLFDLRRRTLETEEVREIELRLADGTPDPSFGQGGRVAVEGGDGLATLGNGNIVVGVRSCGAGMEGSLMELDPRGAAVPGFGRGGCSAPLPFEARVVTADAQGRILVAGSIAYCEPCNRALPPSTEVVVGRLLPDGSRDPGFGNGGVVRTHAEHVIEDVGLDPSPITGVAATADGGVMVGGGSSLIRLDERGAAVMGFGAGGAAAVPGNASVFHLQPDGYAVVASTEGDPEGRILVSRFGPDSKLDASFGKGGTTVLSLPSPEAEAIAPAPGGGVLIAGRRGGDEDCRPCTGTPIVARITAAGQPDPTYGSAGVVNLPMPPLHGLYAGPPSARALLVGADGSAVAAGTDQSEDAFAVALNPAGQPSPAFAEAGTLVERHEVPTQLEATGLALGPKGEFTAGARRSTAPGLRSGFLLGFGPSGKQRFGAAKTDSVETLSHGQVEPLGGGRVVIWGGEPDDRTLRGLGPDGEPLPGYGKSGVARFPRGFTPEAVARAPGGGVAVVGAIGPRAMAVYRLGPRGRAVRSFGHDGLARVIYPHGSAIAFDGVVEGDGRIVLTGWVDSHVGAARLLPNGRLDPSFGHGGLVRGLLRGGTFGLLIAPWNDGVVIATMRKDVLVTAQGMIRLDRHGRLVRDFGRRGVVDPVEEKPALALLTGGGRIVVVTDPTFERHYRGHGVKLRAYRPDGVIDRSFGRGGLTLYGRGTPGKHEFAPAAAVQQPDGRIVIVGTSYSRNHHTKLELVRFR